MKGVTIGDYVLGTRVGSGGVGDVYRATDSMLEREVAIKFLRPGFGSQPELVQRFRSEARTLAQLHHPNIATLYALHREGDTLAMIMELVDGKTVASLLAEHGKLSLPIALAIFFQALDGIGCAHASGVVHRDIKPSNLMLSRSGVLKVMDFGIARCAGTHRVTRAGNTVGTAQYMSPEQVQGRETDARSDIYALCIVLYEMLTDRLPFSGEVEYEVMRAQVETPPPSPCSYVPEIPPAIEAAILKGLAKQPSDRFASTEELRDCLRAAVGVQVMGASELGGWLMSSEKAPPPGLANVEVPPSNHGLTELLFSVEDADALVAPELGAETSPRAARSAPLVWELPEATPAHDIESLGTKASSMARAQTDATLERLRASAPTRVELECASAGEDGPEQRHVSPTTSPTRAPLGRWARSARVALQASALMLIAVSVGTPGPPASTNVAASIDSAQLEPLTELAFARTQTSAEAHGTAVVVGLHFPVAWIDTRRFSLAMESPVTPAHGSRHDSTARSGRSKATSPGMPTAVASPSAPRPKPPAIARKDGTAAADEEPGLRSFVEPKAADEAPAASGAGEWVLRR